ncbi:MAG: serine/threonine protein kinase [Myxococcales bacterium]|nr:serine/threonine protein kinase [Myxococcales bacterium]
MGTTREPVVKTGDVVEGRYRIIKTLGQGGMGTVFLAEHALIKRRVAIKILHPELASDANVVERFMNEARAAGTLGHPNIVESTDMGFTTNHVPYIVFEYLEGTLLTDEIYRVGGLPVRRAVRIAEQIASALLAAHNASIVHRDLKSDNVFLTDKDDALDHVKVLDFGISRFMKLEDRQKNTIMGTPEFMAPEQITSPDSVDKRADIYALGVILYEMLTARRPFSNEDDPRALMHRIVNEAPPPLMRPEVPDGLSRLIMGKLLAKRPADRFQTMNDVEAALDAFVTRGDGTPVPRRRTQPIPTPKIETEFDLQQAETAASIPRLAKISTTPYPSPVETLDVPQPMKAVTLGDPPPVRRPYALYGVAGVGILVGAIGLVVGMRGGDKTPPPAPVAQIAPAPAPLPAASMPAPRQAQKVSIQLEADAAGARVVFRRRIAASPTTMQITPSDIVELVEISAPGYKSQRYWLTFDRPTHLHAHLVKGAGSLEATEEETLVALGEVAAPAQAIAVAAPAPQQAAAAPTAPVAAKTVVVAKAETPIAVEPTKTAPPEQMVAARAAPAAPRKIGRAAAEAIETTAGAPLATPEPAKDETPIAAAEPAKVQTPEPAKVEPAKVADILPEPARPQTMPDLDKPKTIDAATVSSVVAAHRPEVLKCFSEGKKKDHSMKGTITLQLTVEGAGKVHRVQVQSTLNAPLVAACVAKAAGAWKFPTRSSADLASVTYPFTVN